MEITRKCTKCNHEYPLTPDFFYRQKTAKHGLRSQCKQCSGKYRKAWGKKHDGRDTANRNQWRNASEENKQKCQDATNRWKREHPEKYNAYWRRYNRKIRLKALQCVSSDLKCVRCGCDKVELLDINHKECGGYAEFKQKTHSTYIRDIIKGRRGTDDLEILCKLCNNLHYMEFKFGKLPFTISWNPNNEAATQR